ncbi:MAG: pilin [Patescibacteria group bacterium]|nr:pilin [Patescibacteria group bacterium]
MKNSRKISLFILFLTFSFVLGNFVLAVQSSCPGGSGLCDPFNGKQLTDILQKIIGYLIGIGAPIVAIMVIYGGFLILTAGDSPEKVKSGKDVILWAVVGYVIVLCSWGVLYIIKEITGANIPALK